jgi:glycosyltransferase involved in cell wall biosynthesis
LKVSIITVVYNNCNTLLDTIHSVASQDYTDIEYIVVDGNSTDGTRELITANQHLISHWISEPDKGIYDAMNKGLRMANGEIVAFLNADDFYTDKSVISKVVAAFQKNKTDALYADLIYINKNKTKTVRTWKSGAYKAGDFLWGWMPPHPTFFVKKEVYLKYGLFDTSLRQAADYELMLRFIHKYNISLCYLPEVIVKMRVGGQSNATLKNRLIAFKEDTKAWQINQTSPYFFTLLLKSIRKISQFLIH